LTEITGNDDGKWPMAYAAFNPQKFLARIDVNKLIEHNEAYNENRVDRLLTPCILWEQNLWGRV
jgi:hypothetical protein